MTDERKSVEEFVAKTEVRTRRIFISALVSLSIIALCTAVAIFGLGGRVQENHDLIQQANAQATATQFQFELAKEKVCSQSSDRQIACRALFERLAGVLSPEQRFRLACQTALYLKGPTARRLLAENPRCKEVK